MDIKVITAKITAPFCRSGSWLKGNRLGVFSFIFAFVVMTTFIDITLSRNAAIRTLKAGIARLTSSLNEVGLDIAYDKISFNNIFIYPLVEIENLQLYNLRGTELWKVRFAGISGRPGLFSSRRINLDFAGDIEISVNENRYNTDIGSAQTRIEMEKDGSLQELQVYLKDMQIKDIAKIADITLAMRKLHNSISARALIPTIESHLEVNDITLNGLLNYPLTSEIRRIYANFNLMGSLDDGDTFLLAAENWLHTGGFIEIPSLVVSWNPLLLVGRGTVTFNENFSPKLQLQTSSKALLDLLNDLQEKSFLERKGVFVANILLGAKAFKMHEDDKYLTITTPITYRDNKLAIENITVKTLKP